MKFPKFHTSYIDPAYKGSMHYFIGEDSEHVMVPASYFHGLNVDPEECHNKVVVGRWQSISYVSNGMHLGRPTMVIGRGVGAAGSKKMKPSSTTNGPGTCLCIFSDLMAPGKCYAIFRPNKISLQSFFGNGNETVLSETVRIGDCFAIKDPVTSYETLGDSIVILRDPVCVVKVQSTGWVPSDVRTSTVANFQTSFDIEGKKIKIFNPRIIIGNSPVTTCGGYMCDRQTKCPGCLGRCETYDPIVMSVDVSIQDCPNYNSSNGRAYFERFTSLRTSKLFFKDLNSLSTKPVGVLPSMYDQVRKNVKAMVELINEDGGWHVSGWHRQGLRDTTTGDSVLSDATKGHITYLYPTTPSVMDKENFQTLLIDTPSDNILTPEVAADAPAVQALASPLGARAAAAATVSPNNGDN